MDCSVLAVKVFGTLRFDIEVHLPNPADCLVHDSIDHIEDIASVSLWVCTIVPTKAPETPVVLLRSLPEA